MTSKDFQYLQSELQYLLGEVGEFSDYVSGFQRLAELSGESTHSGLLNSGELFAMLNPLAQNLDAYYDRMSRLVDDLAHQEVTHK